MARSSSPARSARSARSERRASPRWLIVTIVVAALAVIATMVVWDLAAGVRWF